MWLRLDCDNPIFYKNIVFRGCLNYFSLATNLHIPFIHNKPILETKQFLKNYDIERTWFFRPFTCPEIWDEPFGLHATYKDVSRFSVELMEIQEKLGYIHSFTHHGFAPVKSGCVWSLEDIKHIENMFDLRICLMFHITLLIVCRSYNPTMSVSYFIHLISMLQGLN